MHSDVDNACFFYTVPCDNKRSLKIIDIFCLLKFLMHSKTSRSELNIDLYSCSAVYCNDLMLQLLLSTFVSSNDSWKTSMDCFPV